MGLGGTQASLAFIKLPQTPMCCSIIITINSHHGHYHLHPHTKSPEIFTRQAKPSNPGFTSSALHCYLSPGWLQTGQIRRQANLIQRNLNHFDKMGSMSTRPGIVGCNCCNWRGRYIHSAPDIKAVWRHCQIARACEIPILCDTK